MAQSSSKMLNVGHDDKLFSRLLSKEKYNSSKQGEASFRVLYYGGAAGSVPFLWESQPGTPKHKFNDNPLPPLTPPPSYQFSPQANLQKKNYSRNSKVFNSIFSRVPSKKSNASPLFSPSSSSSFSSSYSLPSTPFNSRKGDFKARSRSAVRFGLDNEDEYEEGKVSPISTLCFGARSGSSSRRFTDYYPIKSVKKVVLSIVGHAKVN
ncbi:hypothetical protein BUALT_Bualt06G0069200 [Buddleja alternifolia]|uniref:Uncharacterized protein n=1 Tax=Buddleja alternifolia TaxID=168488 RepID=A0AAV6XL69_9LAMI|nr:hypothetical protein BUALT_Bualt06G0069200 [Buddleja alternifolia]